MMKRVPIIKPDSTIASASFMLAKKDTKVRITWSLDDLNLQGEVEANDYFECLLQIRNVFEKNNLIILCNGARYDVYPSRMSRQMGKGLKGYVLTLGKQADEKDLVDIFKPIEDKAKIGTDQQQRDYYNKMAW
ncbi:MAG: hypothetical protein ACOYXT_22055 [Bacteroidota bacterium]